MKKTVAMILMLVMVMTLSVSVPAASSEDQENKNDVQEYLWEISADMDDETIRS